MNRSSENRVRLTADNWIALVGVLLTVSGGFYFALDRRFAAIEESIKDHEIRLTRREANAFTSQEANALANNVARLTIELTQQEKTLERQRANTDSVQAQLREVVSELREVAPKDVKKTVMENQTMIRELLKHLGN